MWYQKWKNKYISKSTTGERQSWKEVFNISEVNEISYNSKIYIVPKYKGYSLASMKIEFRENPNKWIKLFYKNELLVKYNLEASNEK